MSTHASACDPLLSVVTMRQEVRQSRSRLWCGAVALAVSAILLAPATAPATQPAIDEYTLRLPTAQGASHPTTAPPVNADELSPAVVHRLSSIKDGVTLEQIATSRELGAPKPSGKAPQAVDADGRGVVAAAFAAVGDSSGLLLLGALIAVTLLAWFTRRGRQIDS
jgi:hypothetical protein